MNPMHITAAVYVNDDEGGLIADIDVARRLAPHEPVSGYRTAARTTPTRT